MIFNSSAVLLIDATERFLLQKRDIKEDIYFPGLWGLFGGACELDENSQACAIREIREELSISLLEINLFLKIEINAKCMGSSRRTRHFYVGRLEKKIEDQIKLNEGSEYRFFNGKSLPKPHQIVPFDLAAIMLYYHSMSINYKLCP